MFILCQLYKSSFIAPLAHWRAPKRKRGEISPLRGGLKGGRYPPYSAFSACADVLRRVAIYVTPDVPSAFYRPAAAAPKESRQRTRHHLCALPLNRRPYGTLRLDLRIERYPVQSHTTYKDFRSVHYSESHESILGVRRRSPNNK